MSKWIGVHTGGAHYLDHLGILCEGLDIPLYVTDETTLQAAHEFYPYLEVHYRDLSELSLSFLAEKADVIFESGHSFAMELIPLWELLHRKTMRVVYCPHGNSDKISPPYSKDISLYYGTHMKQHLQTTGESAGMSLIRTGNYRWSYYQHRRQWYDEKLNSRLRGAWNPNKKTVFYAPSWEGTEWIENSWKVLGDITRAFNLLYRVHPFTQELYPVEYEQLQSMGGINLSYFPSIYPILQLCDYYIGDRSSIGYDFLMFDKPLFFVTSAEGDIYKCGITLDKTKDYEKQIEAFQYNAFFQDQRQRLARKVFGRKKSFSQIKNEIKKALS